MLPIVYHPNYGIIWPDDHRFPMTKFQMLYEYLLNNGIAVPEQFRQPELVSINTLQQVHDPDYLDAFCNGTLDAKAIRRTGMGWYPDLVLRTRAEVGGAILTAKLALQHGLACNTAGGTHHAFPDYGSGFCFLNDIAVAARLVIDKGWAKRVLIIDLDVHQGDGTAFIFRNEPRVFTWSVHAARNFPARKQQSDLDTPLANGTGDDEYLTVITQILPDLLTRFNPDLVFYDAGVDPFHNDKLGRLSLTREGLYRRDRYVLETCLAEEVPVACLIGGGYAHDRNELASLHAIIHQAATEVWNSKPQ